MCWLHEFRSMAESNVRTFDSEPNVNARSDESESTRLGDDHVLLLLKYTLLLNSLLFTRDTCLPTVSPNHNLKTTYEL